MAANEPTTRRTSTTSVIAYFLVTIMFAAVGTIAGFRLMLAWPALMGGGVPAAAPAPQPTAFIRPATPAIAQPARDAAPVVIPGIAQNAATTQALFDAAVLAGEEIAPANIGQSAPATVQERPAEERQGAGENVPTAEPVVNGQFGSNAADPPVNVQETQQCKHGQVWTARGCKNPTPVQ